MLHIRTFFVVIVSILLSACFHSLQAQILNTKLQVTVRDDSGNLVEGASIRLFTSEEDYNKEQNQVGKTIRTDEKGRASFDTLEPKIYYIIVEKGDMDNSDGGTKTEALTPKRINKITIIIS
ncbi:carboxypeptidase-like regulatory domain-containing protein [Rhodocytophaga aerolata]|uniref:Carboxypeptidase-like regulatory domain-containing protein n=1 Tax=Rhodocytophaga aerolata TaxID=455078 RepID=A0ABT8QZE8_9BACT|nr:carboxypeptidase-like regulatory domain-containing protein [Rhodocytophaga aerolata]MDO1445217.1 carboxypeptidase-like regulatory domain-containing protein [Rhodocytophaga aerolata]